MSVDSDKDISGRLISRLESIPIHPLQIHFQNNLGTNYLLQGLLAANLWLGRLATVKPIRSTRSMKPFLGTT